ncbi:hypothetical protein JI721_15720 [Alicyclobacillus cycloheptanicus]|uniref:Uncharacterized protein n=1 Tax=Alicyclobacillus cycloheptanicus TaxID=1457 RepID=A0ABT9XEZ4_9BACL|nr:hypothetical protein [Alicyclobacillus cycloheptanicus]MDQ0188388.1 hypothetical protein [Alicyclobacillus cycloheptanicus]WDM01094.1 hypothetical protein JI721_15720 [Alicyclobacillus cycloheptanicus]
MITRAHVMPYIGQRVVVRTHDGAVHHGILHHVTNDGIYLRKMGPGPRLAADAKSSSEAVVPLGELPQTPGEADLAWWPFFFLPWLAIAAFAPWGWWW